MSGKDKLCPKVQNISLSTQGSTTHIGVFVEKNDGSLQPVTNIYEADLSAWRDKEFEA